MRNFNTVIASAILLGLISVGNAVVANNSVKPEVSKYVKLSIDNGVATLTGTVKDDYERQTMETAASALDGVNQVRNYLSVSASSPKHSDKELAQHATASDLTNS